MLREAEEWAGNFAGVDRVHFLEDCLPRFNALMIAFLDKAWAYVYEDGPPLDAADLPAFSLDTGRLVHDFDNIALRPVLWEVA